MFIAMLVWLGLLHGCPILEIYVYVYVMLVVSHWKLIVHGDRLFRLELFSGL